MPRIDYLARLDLQTPVANHEVDVAQIFDPLIGTAGHDQDIRQLSRLESS